jgi:hypothetical protein
MHTVCTRMNVRAKFLAHVTPYGSRPFPSLPPARRCRLSRRLMALRSPALPALPHGRSYTPVQPARRVPSGIPSGGRMVAARRLFYRVSGIDCTRRVSSNGCCVWIADRHLHLCARLPAWNIVRTISAATQHTARIRAPSSSVVVHCLVMSIIRSGVGGEKKCNFGRDGKMGQVSNS